jgi:hypothetical protein
MLPKLQLKSGKTHKKRCMRWLNMYVSQCQLYMHLGLKVPSFSASHRGGLVLLYSRLEKQSYVILYVTNLSDANIKRTVYIALSFCLHKEQFVPCLKKQFAGCGAQYNGDADQLAEQPT